ncbi:TRAP transporter permease [Parendozoicomonas sp. Alg238-R29]|uniref:TRAP transporter permease n=1 Tax=Parendozoicomonas sp. Alg238-R29 TaxID=2993446 RepID=UPI00248E602D|nr:TRAP transporter permease [Parendozoicomonas sp. Alg238-R29]
MSGHTPNVQQAELQKQLAAFEQTQREESSLAGRFIYWFGIAFALLHIWFNTLGTMSELWVSAIHFGGFALICALMVPAVSNKAENKWLLSTDFLLGGLALSSAAYLIFFETALFDRGQTFITSDWIFSFIAIAIVLELTRRTAGWFIPAMILVALTYVFWWGKHIGGVFQFPGLSLETVMFRSYFSTEGMFGPIARISWSYVFMFILFGAFLVKSGAGDFIIDLSRAVAGRFVGGPGFVAVFGSGLMGSVSGSSVANTVSTGVITIPLMRRAGFPAKFSAGVEAAASTGGQLMPPVMGAGAFIMATFTQISYVEIITWAALPALLYFLSVAFFVRIEAQRSHAHVVETDTEPALSVLKKGWHYLLPLGFLVALLVTGFTPTYAAGFSILAVIAASWFGKHKMGIREVLDALADGSRNMAKTAMLLIGVGLVINVISSSGVGNTFSLMVSDWANGSLLITIVLVALASLVLGMGLPVTAAYIVLATLSAPAIYQLIAQTALIDMMVDGTLPEQAKAFFLLADPEKAMQLSSGLNRPDAIALLELVPGDFKATLLEQALAPETLTMMLLAAHMIIFWLSQDSNVTPPVCLTAFAAAAIAKTPPMITGLYSWKIAKGLYIVPLLFAYTPLIGGDWQEVLQVFFFSVFGIYATVALLEGYLESRLNVFSRLLCGFAGVGMLWPHGYIAVSLVSLGIFIGIFLYSRRKHDTVVMEVSVS